MKAIKMVVQVARTKKKQIITYSWLWGVAEFSDLFGPFALYPDQLNFTWFDGNMSAPVSTVLFTPKRDCIKRHFAYYFLP